MPIERGMLPHYGIHYNIPPDDYHAWPACSHSWLSRLRISPAHLLDLIQNGPDGSSEAQVFGQAVHCAVLEPNEFPKRYDVRPEGLSGATKEGKMFKAAAIASGRAVLSAEEGRWIEAVASRAADNPVVREWLSLPHHTEVSILWERDGYPCKARLDLLVPGLNLIADLKTTVTASPAGFARHIARYHYHTQGAWYAEGIRALTGREHEFQIIAVEKRRPFLVAVHKLVLGSTAHGAAMAECDRLFDLYKQCNKSGQWPGYAPSTEIELPEWALAESGETEEPFE